MLEWQQALYMWAVIVGSCTGAESSKGLRAVSLDFLPYIGFLLSGYLIGSLPNAVIATV